MNKVNWSELSSGIKLSESLRSAEDFAYYYLLDPEGNAMQPVSHDLTFSQALDMLKKGNKVTRAGWNGRNMFLFLVSGSQFTVNRAPLMGIYPEGTTIDYHAHIDMKTAHGYVVPWVASQADLLSNDWILIA